MGFQTSLLWLNLYMLYLKKKKMTKLTLIGRLGWHKFGDFKEKPTTASKPLHILIINLPFSSLYVRRKGMPLECSPKDMGQSVYRILQPTTRPCGTGISLLPQSLSCHPLLIKDTTEIMMGTPLTIFVPHAEKPSKISSPSTLFSHLTSHEILLLIAHHITYFLQ